MKRKLFSAILFGALLTASTSGLTSCKDYDDDISNLQSQIDKLATADQLSAKVSELQAAISAAQSAAESKAAAAETVAKAAQSAADAAATAASKAQSTADGASQAAKDAAAAAAAANEVGKAAQAAVDKLAAEGHATKAELEAAKEAAAAAVKAIQDAHATDKAAIEKAIADSKTELLEKINANAAALAALDTRLTAVEAQLKAIIDGEGGETSLDVIAAEVEAIGDALEDLIGAFTMATSIDIYNGVDGYDNALNFWKVKEAVTAEFPREANAKEADGEAYVFKTGTERVYEDSVLVRVNPVDATLDADHIVLLNSQGAELSSDLVECVEARAFESSNPLVTRAAGNGTGLWVVKFKATDKLISDKDVQKEFKAATVLGNNKILFALGTDESYEAADVDRRLVTAYALTMGCDDAKRASEFTVNDKAVGEIKNRFTTSEEGVQVPKDVYGIDYKWRYIDEDGKKNPVVNTEIVTKADDKNNYNVVDDNRNGQKVLVAEVGQSITISFPTSKPIKGFYVTLDYKRAIESAASEINAWNTYEYENVAKINKKGEVIEAATLQNGNVGYIQVNDLKDYASVGDVIGFRVFAVNLDGTLVDPDGQAFYVGFGESEEVADEKEIEGQTIEVKYSTTNDAATKNITDFIDVEDAFGGVTFDQIAWTASVGADNVAPTVGNTSGNIRITYYKADKKTEVAENKFGNNGYFWEDVKYIKAAIADPTYLVDNATYTLTATLGVKVGNSSYKVRTVTMPLTKKMPTTLPDGKTVQFNLFQGTEQLAIPGTGVASDYVATVANLKEGAYNAWGQWQTAVGTSNEAKAERGKWGLDNIGTTFSGTPLAPTVGLSTYVDLNNIYVFSDETRLAEQVGTPAIGFVVKSIAANTGNDNNHKNLLDVDATYTTTSVKAQFAGNFVNNGNYNVNATYTYKDISRKLCDKATGKAPETGVAEANKIWSNPVDGADGNFATGKGNISNDYDVAVPAPAIRLMAWSTCDTNGKYMSYKWREKCIAAGSTGTGATASKWVLDNEFVLGNTITIDLNNVYAYFGSMVKELPLAGGNITLGSLVTANNLLVCKTGSSDASLNAPVQYNVYTKATIGGRTQTNPVFKPDFNAYTGGNSITLKRINMNPVEDHMETLYVETIDCFGHKELVSLDFYVKSAIQSVETCADGGPNNGQDYRKAN